MPWSLKTRRDSMTGQRTGKIAHTAIRNRGLPYRRNNQPHGGQVIYGGAVPDQPRGIARTRSKTPQEGQRQARIAPIKTLVRRAAQPAKWNHRGPERRRPCLDLVPHRELLAFKALQDETVGQRPLQFHIEPCLYAAVPRYERVELHRITHGCLSLVCCYPSGPALADQARLG